MKKVKIFKLQNDGTQKAIAVCSLVEGEIVCEGDEKFIKYLEKEGITDYSAKTSKKIFVQDGEKFLEQLKNNFTSGYLNATDIIEEFN